MPPWPFALPFFHWLKGHHHAAHEMRFEKASRYYVLRLEKDLFENWVILVINGRIQSKLGKTRTLAFENYNTAFKQFALLGKMRLQRQYALVNYQTANHLFFSAFFCLLQDYCLTKDATRKNKPRSLKPSTASIMTSVKSSKSNNHQIAFEF